MKKRIILNLLMITIILLSVILVESSTDNISQVRASPTLTFGKTQIGNMKILGLQPLRQQYNTY